MVLGCVSADPSRPWWVRPRGLPTAVPLSGPSDRRHVPPIGPRGSMESMQSSPTDDGDALVAPRSAAAEALRPGAVLPLTAEVSIPAPPLGERDQPTATARRIQRPQLQRRRAPGDRDRGERSVTAPDDATSRSKCARGPP